MLQFQFPPTNLTANKTNTLFTGAIEKAKTVHNEHYQAHEVDQYDDLICISIVTKSA